MFLLLLQVLEKKEEQSVDTEDVVAKEDEDEEKDEEGEAELGEGEYDEDDLEEVRCTVLYVTSIN